MSTDVKIAELTTFQIAADGARVRILAKTTDGTPASISLPADCLSQLMMTLPRIALQALHQRLHDDTLKIVYPAATWTIEHNTERGETFILTLATPDGFEVSFALSRAKLDAMGRAIAGAAEKSQAREPVLSLN
jgi:hypothetical protein